MTQGTDVLIVGAGPVGLTLALELARRQVRPLIVDKAPGIREVSKALILHVRTQEILSRAGVTQAALAEARPLRSVTVNAYGKWVGSWDLDDIDGPYAHPLILGQNRTQHLLMDALSRQGVSVEWDTEVFALEIDARVARATLRQSRRERTVEVPFVIGCEGSNSIVRKTSGFTFEGERYSGEQFIQADCRIRWPLPSGGSYLFLTADGYLMVIEMPNGLVRIFISLPDNNAAGAAEAAQQLGAAEATSETPTLEEISQHLERLAGFPSELTDPVWLARYRTSHRYANHFRHGPAFVAGDAGHVHVPIGGQGMNTGIQDACNLGWKLAGVLKSELHPLVLDSYEAERRPVAESLIRGTDFAYRGILHPNELRQRAARMIGPFLLRSPRVQGFMRETLEELSISYPRTALNLDLGGARGPAPGERALDATVVRSKDLATTTLWTEMPDDAWTLLLFATDAANAADLGSILKEARERYAGRLHPLIVHERYVAPHDHNDTGAALLDALGHAHERYGVRSPAAFVIRPDTFVAVRAPIAKWSEVSRHLATIFA